jgi:uncharacterized protein (TIGR02117 family)
MIIVKRILKWFIYFLLIPISYFVLSLFFTFITIDRKVENTISDKTIFISTNGVHLDIVLPKESIDSTLLYGLHLKGNEKYLSFGWGDENFYLNTPTWGDLTFKNAFSAMFLGSPTLMHITRHNGKASDWVEIKINDSELKNLTNYIHKTFKTNENGMKIIVENKGYSAMDDFYKANGSYSCLKTCNSWVNKGFKESGLKSCFWTPFDFGLLNKYEK